MEKNFVATFVDELFAEPTYTFGGIPSKPKEVGSSNGSLKGTNKSTISMDMQKKTGGVKNIGGEGKKNGRESSRNISADAAWKEIQKACSSLPKLRGVDERAEEFISKFRQNMRLEREQSLVEFQEMLARGV